MSSENPQPDDTPQQMIRFKYMHGGGAAAPEVSGTPITTSSSFDDSGMSAAEAATLERWQAALEGSRNG